MTGIKKAQRLFQKAGLAFPMIPEVLAMRLEEKGKWCFSTRKLDISPYILQYFVSELDGYFFDQCRPRFYKQETRATHVPDYALLCNSGYGIHSYALQYYLVYGRLALFLHLGWGGVYMDPVDSADKIRDCFALADAIVPLVQVSPRLPAEGRLTIVGSDFYGSYWAPHGANRLRKEAIARRLVRPNTLSVDKTDNKYPYPKRPVEVLTEVLEWLKRATPNQSL